MHVFWGHMAILDNKFYCTNKFQASPVNIGDRQAIVEEKKTNTRGNLFFYLLNSLIIFYCYLPEYLEA